MSAVTTEKHRATALSTSGLMVKFVYMSTAPIMGYNFANGAYNIWMYAALAVLTVVAIYAVTHERRSLALSQT